MFINKKNKNIFNLNKKNKKAFTLQEVIVATFISILMLSFIFIFISDIIEGISSSDNEVKVLSSFYDFTNKLNNYRNVYITGGILVDNTVGSDIFLMEDPSGENGILFGPVKLSDSKLNTDITIYENKGLGFRKISSDEMDAIDLNTDVIYTYQFQKDQIFSDLKIQDLILIKYNSGELYDLSLIVDLDFQSSLVGQQWIDLPRDTLKKFNINF